MEGPLKTLLYLEQLASSGVKFKSFTEPMLDTTTPVGELLIPILAWVAKQERQRISDRTRAVALPWYLQNSQQNIR